MVPAWQLCWKNVSEERKRNGKEARKSRFAKVNYAVREGFQKGSAGAEWNQRPARIALVNGKLSLKRGNAS